MKIFGSLAKSDCRSIGHLPYRFPLLFSFAMPCVWLFGCRLSTVGCVYVRVLRVAKINKMMSTM